MAKFEEILKKAGVDESVIASLPNSLDDLLIAKEDHDKALVASNTRISELSEYQSRMDAWRSSNWDDALKMTKAQAEAERRVLDLTSKLAERDAVMAGLPAGSDMTFEQIEHQLKEKGYVTKTEFDQVTARAAAAEQSVKNYSAGMEFVYAETAALPIQYFSEFGKAMPMREFMSYLAAAPERQKDVGKSYTDFTATVRAEKQFSEKVAAFEKKEAEWTAEQAKIKERQSSSPLPTDGGEFVSPFQQMVENPGNNPIDKIRGDAPVTSTNLGGLGNKLSALYAKGELVVPGHTLATQR